MSDNTLKTRTTPLSVRLTAQERDILLVRAGGRTLSAFVKQVLFDETGPTPRGGGMTLANRTLLAHLLATLGASQLAPNLDRLARDAENGILYADDDTTRRLREACDDVRLMHNALMRGLGMREKAPSQRQIDLTATFNRVAKPKPEDSN